MSTATRCYTTVAAVKADVGLAGPDLDSLILRNIKAATEHIENILGRRFIPQTATKLYRWPSSNGFKARDSVSHPRVSSMVLSAPDGLEECMFFQKSLWWS